MGICYGFRSVAARVKYPGFMLLVVMMVFSNIAPSTVSVVTYLPTHNKQKINLLQFILTICILQVFFHLDDPHPVLFFSIFYLTFAENRLYSNIIRQYRDMIINSIIIFCECNELIDNLFNSSTHSAAFMRHWIGSALVQIMACRLFGAKPLSKPMLGYWQLDP